MGNSFTRAKKNSLIELMRFLFAVWVLYFHSYVPYKNDLFTQGSLAVEFFFVLSGFYLIRSIDKYSSLPTKQGLVEFLKHRFLSIAAPFLICEVFVLYHEFFIEPSINVFFGYLWYIRDLFIAMAAIFLLRRFVKSERVFYIILCVLSIIAFSAFQWVSFMAWPGGPFRSIAAMPIGMLAALVPKIKLKEKRAKGNLTKSIAIGTGFAFSALLCLAIAALPDKSDLTVHLLVILVYPSMLYFASCIRFSFGFFDWLGSLSFPIYAFQCVIRVTEHYFIKDEAILFAILMAIVLVYSLVENTVKIYKRNFSQNQPS